MKHIKQEISSEPVIDSLRAIAIHTKVPVEQFYKCVFCGELADDQLMILDYNVSEIELKCDDCSSWYGIHHEKGVVHHSEVYCF